MNQPELLEQLNPTIEAAHAAHMSQGLDRPQREPLIPEIILARAASPRGTKLKDLNPDPQVWGPVIRTSYEEHIDGFQEKYGVDLRPVLAATFVVNLLTEDNLPHYTSRISEFSEEDSPLGNWKNEWTAEEDAHGVLMREYATHAGLISNYEGGLISYQEYSKGRAEQLRHGTEINPASLRHAFIYLAIQEDLTKDAHTNLSWILDGRGRSVLRPIGGEENDHKIFYTTVAKEAFNAEDEPDNMLIAMHEVYVSFAMPGQLGIPDFDELALTIGVAGVFDLETIVKSKRRLVEEFGIADMKPTTVAGQKAQAAILRLTSDRSIERQKKIMEGLRDDLLARSLESGGPLPFILGRTIDYEIYETVQGGRITGLEKSNLN